MKSRDQSRKEVSAPTSDLLVPNQTIKIGCWNVRTLYQTGKLAQTIKEMNQYNLSILGVTEARWTGTGLQRMGSGETIIWSGRQDDNHQEGVALIAEKKTAKTILQWKPINERLLYVRFNSKFAKLSVIVAYAPTDVAEEEEKEEFYTKLQASLVSIPKHDVLLLMGDFNARVGKLNVGKERFMGKEGIGEISANGEKLVDFCEENDLVIGGTLFMHRDIHKLTWTSPDGRTQSQIDHIIINGKWRHSLLDVRVKRQADVGSDHNLVVAKLKLKLRKVRLGEEKKPRFDVDKLKNPETKKQFVLELKNRFQVLQNDTSISIDSFNKILSESGESTLGFRKGKKREWISDSTWKEIEERKMLKKKLLSTKSARIREKIADQYREQDKSVKNAARKDKRMYIEKLAEDAETAAELKDLKTVYEITRKLMGKKKQNQEIPVKSEDDTLITEERAKLERWRQHFQEVLNRPDPVEFADIPEAEEDLEINTGGITVEEVKEAIRHTKSGKAPGADGICAEMLKVESQELPKILQEILQKIWETEEIPNDWKTGIIIKLPKKGDLSNCNNWRGITLLSITSKIFGRIILRRITGAIDSILRQEQTGFRKGRSCMDHIFTLRQIIEQSEEWNSALYIVFVDFEKAFDSVHRDSMWRILRHYGIPDKIVRVIRALYENFECRVAHNNKLSDTFQVKSGVRQGCILSPILFSLAIDWIMHKTLDGRRQGIQWTLTSILEDLDYADDLSLLASRHQDIQQKTNNLAKHAALIGLKVNTGKTKVLKINATVRESLSLEDKQLEEVEEFIYLGSEVTNDGNCFKEVKNRIGKARQAFGMLRNVWKSGKISLSTKLRIFKSNVLSVLLYGSECWKTTNAIEMKLEGFQNKCLRQILRIFWPNIISNEELLRRTRIQPLTIVIRHRRWRWLGHVLRMRADKLAKTALRWTPQGKRKRGRPKETWRRSMEKELKEEGLTFQQAEVIARDRMKWRSLVEASCANGR